MPATRDQIIGFLRKNPTASTVEISRSLQITKAGVRYHLNLLVGLKKIEKVTLPGSNKKGRPTYLFRLAKESLPENFSHLIDGLFAILQSIVPPQEIAPQLAAYLAGQIPPQITPTQKLNRLRTFFTQNGYTARWEAYTSGPRILFRSCPYAAILPEHPELCAMDAGIISTYLGQPFEQTARIDTEYAKIPACVFTLKTHQEA